MQGWKARSLLERTHPGAPVKFGLKSDEYISIDDGRLTVRKRGELLPQGARTSLAEEEYIDEYV